MDNTQLYHFGIKGQRWGVRRFQNSDGSLTRAGRNKVANNVVGAREKLSNQAKGYKTYGNKIGGTVQVKRAKIGSKEHGQMIKDKVKRLSGKNARDRYKISNGIRKAQNTAKKDLRAKNKALLTKDKQSSGSKRAKVALGVVGGLIAADYISAKVNGQPTVTQAVANLIKVSQFGG